MDAPRENLTRTVPFEIERSTDDGDGLTLEGYAAVFDSPTEIASRAEGHFIERIKPGAFAKTTTGRVPALLYEHGQGFLGKHPIGVVEEAREDLRGLFVRARLSDNWLVQPVRDAIADGAISGMSFSMAIPDGGDKWRRSRTGGLPERDITEIKLKEVSPVLLPAYSDTTVSVRSQEVLDALTDNEVRADIARALFRADTQPYGDTAYADPGYKDDKVKRYPINTGAHVKAAWAYINMERNQQGYTPEQVASIKGRIKSAAKKFDVTIDDSAMKSQEPEGETRAWMMSDLCGIVEDAIEDQLYEDQMVCVVDVSDDGNAYFCVMEDGEMELYEIPFTVDDAGKVALGDHSEVLKKTTYVPATSDESAEGGPRSKTPEPAGEAIPDIPEPSGEDTPRGATDPATARFLRQLAARERGV